MATHGLRLFQFFEQPRKTGEVVVAHPEGGRRDVQALCAGAGSTFDPLAGKNAFLVVVFDLTHLGAQVGAFDQPWVGVSAGKNQFKAGRLHIDKFNSPPLFSLLCALARPKTEICRALLLNLPDQIYLVFSE